MARCIAPNQHPDGLARFLNKTAIQVPGPEARDFLIIGWRLTEHIGRLSKYF